MDREEKRRIGEETDLTGNLGGLLFTGLPVLYFERGRTPSPLVFPPPYLLLLVPVTGMMDLILS